MSELVLVANAADGTLSTLRLHRTGGTEGGAWLEPLALVGELPGCSTFAVDAGRDLVHAAYKDDDGAGLATLSLDRETGEVVQLRTHAIGGKLTYLSLARDGDVLLGESYGEGKGWSWPVEDGVIQEPVSEIAFRNLHGIVSDDTYVYCPALGEDLIAQYRLGEGGELEPLDPPTVSAPAGSGPRHLIIDGDNTYLVTEFSGELIRYGRGGDGTLTEAESVHVAPTDAGLSHSRFGADPMAEHLIWGADVHRAGRFVITSERTTSTLTVTALDGEGHLGDVVGIFPTQAQPRGFAVTSDGAFVIAVGERSTSAQLSRVESGGELTPLGTAPIGRGANWVRVVEG